MRCGARAVRPVSGAVASAVRCGDPTRPTREPGRRTGRASARDETLRLAARREDRSAENDGRSTRRDSPSGVASRAGPRPRCGRDSRDARHARARHDTHTHTVTELRNDGRSSGQHAGPGAGHGVSRVTRMRGGWGERLPNKNVLCAVFLI